ncbi:MAG TPA: alpha/beta hydrolase-fold protein [Bryobacteraceae bacterium]|nr:alpha/beta hydrolase-fold protein [Bryobacteraceae bacterium]
MHRFAWAVILSALPLLAQQPFFDRTHDSKVFGEARHYRIILPPAYETTGKRYPVIYYFHGHSDRYTVERYDNGTDTIPKMVDWVSKHDAIVVCVDGYVPANYTGFYGGSPWDLLENGGDHDFGPYFLELIHHVDSTYRTLTDRRHRATSGLSMGGFMSLYLSARYPDWVGSASAFNPGPEFYVGEKDRRVLWSPKEHLASHEHTMVRLIRASGDFISQYHEETRAAYQRSDVDFEFRQDEYHRHWATSIAETLDFHARAFANASLDNVPESWSYSSAYRTFDVWGYQANLTAGGSGVVYLEGAHQGGLRVSTRRWAPDGPPVENAVIQVTTAPLYKPGQTYKLFDYKFSTRSSESRNVTADASGRISFTADGGGHQISFAGPGTGSDAPVLLPVTTSDRLRAEPGKEIHVPLKIYNPRAEPLMDVSVALSSEYPTVELHTSPITIPKIEPGGVADITSKFAVKFTAGAGDFAPALLTLKLTYDGWHEASQNIDVLVAPDHSPAPLAFQILDGRTANFEVFRQKGNQGGGASISRTVTEGRGNGNGTLDPGEEVTIWVQLNQGLDPFDKKNWYRTKIYSDSPWITEVNRMEEQKQLEWTSAKERTSVIRLSPNTPPGTEIPLLLDNESWSFTFTPDVRYGKERLYQAFQLHQHHLHRLTIIAGGNAR